jgi:hypothetical protein
MTKPGAQRWFRLFGAHVHPDFRRLVSKLTPSASQKPLSEPAVWMFLARHA